MVEIEFVFCVVACVIPYSTPPPFKSGELATSLHLLLPSFNPQGSSLSAPHFTSPLPQGNQCYQTGFYLPTPLCSYRLTHTVHILLSTASLFLFLFLTKKKRGRTKVSSLQCRFWYMNFKITFKTEFQ